MHENELDNLVARSAWGNPQEVRFRLTTISRQWAARPHLWRPPTDLLETEQAYVVRVEVAGMQEAELNIAIEGREMAIYGLRQQPAEQAAYYQMEVRFGEFLSALQLPGEINTDGIQAVYQDGFLTVTLPKVRAS
ncbi:MAG: Hsp20/alpha crystallin family protein [Anaerolineales bacterium]|nr:Hsp20/alpha crystallin family protein [Anaerolineales bacterium]MCL4257825.1 Hsp20/alpha crystallin family protein [Anaerolineales bacterium]QYK49898.1 MAG: Hsp20/alpha crystallin family protein [Anaerolineales bacterium]